MTFCGVVMRVGKSWRLMNSGGGGGRTWPGHLLFLAASHILASLDASQSQRIEYLSFSLPQQRSQGWPEDAKQLTKIWFDFLNISMPLKQICCDLDSIKWGRNGDEGRNKRNGRTFHGPPSGCGQIVKMVMWIVDHLWSAGRIIRSGNRRTTGSNNHRALPKYLVDRTK